MDAQPTHHTVQWPSKLSLLPTITPFLSSSVTANSLDSSIQNQTALPSTRRLSNGIVTGKRNLLDIVEAGELAAYCYNTTSYDRLRICSDFCMYLFILDDLSDGLLNEDTETFADSVMNSSLPSFTVRLRDSLPSNSILRSYPERHLFVQRRAITHNMVVILMKHGKTLQGAINHIGQMCHDTIDNYAKLKNELPSWGEEGLVSV
ncbi:hypothetical protein VNI00_005429 [Paramarasmius palmivorus]|uniref:Uncharacterized protein n=1 Tax=Paramarasmius palmivorus TaxID=297713 RepID=A0AAW0DBA5_9AGAR